jgi:hypothetical protein
MIKTCEAMKRIASPGAVSWRASSKTFGIRISSRTFDERLWCSLVDFITVYSKEDIRVTFKDGTEIGKLGKR